jgi:hypothetical protein
MVRLEAVKGGLLSSSYAPTEGHPKYQPMFNELKRPFQLHKSERPSLLRITTPKSISGTSEASFLTGLLNSSVRKQCSKPLAFAGLYRPK